MNFAEAIQLDSKPLHIEEAQEILKALDSGSVVFRGQCRKYVVYDPFLGMDVESVRPSIMRDVFADLTAHMKDAAGGHDCSETRPSHEDFTIALHRRMSSLYFVAMLLRRKLGERSALQPVSVPPTFSDNKFFFETAHLQHHGLHGVSLDFSTSWLVALSFATLDWELKKMPLPDPIIYCLDLAKIRGASGELAAVETFDLGEPLGQIVLSNLSLIFPQIARINVQRGVFMGGLGMNFCQNGMFDAFSKMGAIVRIVIDSGSLSDKIPVLKKTFDKPRLAPSDEVTRELERLYDPTAFEQEFRKFPPDEANLLFNGPKVNFPFDITGLSNFDLSWRPTSTELRRFSGLATLW